MSMLVPRALGAIQTPPEIMATAFPVEIALAPPVGVPTKFHSPKCDAHVTLNQGDFGACITFSGAYLQADQELVDEGTQLLPGVLDPLHAYALIKGLPWPLTPAQDTNPGLYPQQLWAYMVANGWPTKDGSAPRFDQAYATLGKFDGGSAFLGILQQVLLQLGPAQLTASWPNNWWDTDARGFMPEPSSVMAGGHAFEGCGYEVGCASGYPGCTWDVICHQSWGAFGRDPEFPDHFRIHSPWITRLGWEAWKVIDRLDGSPRHHILVAPHALVQVATMASGNACISGWTSRQWGANASSAPCDAPIIRPGCHSGRAAIVHVTAGAFANRFVRLADGLTVVSR